MKLPEITILSKWLEDDQIKMRLKLTHDGRSMSFDYSGGLLAFLPKERDGEETAQEKERNKVYNRKVKEVISEIRKSIHHREKSGIISLNSEVIRKSGRELALQWARVDEKGVLNSLVIDTSAGEMTFEEFSSEFGYDEDSRKAYSVWEACKQNAQDFRRVVRGSFNEIEEMVRDY